jgi:hypothetical protein
VVHTWSTQFCPDGHCGDVAHWPQLFGPVGWFVSVPQWGVDPLHWASVAHVSQIPPAWHFWPALPQSLSASQMHILFVPQWCVEHWLSVKHSAHSFVLGSQ